VSDDPVVVVLGADAARVGTLTAELRARGLRTGAFIGDPATDRDAVLEMLTELYSERADPT
jgi:hypothetical protein